MGLLLHTLKEAFSTYIAMSLFAAVRAEIMFNDNVPMNKLGLKREQLTNHEYLGSDMIEAGNEFGPDTQYGSALIRVGQAEKR